MQKYIFGDQMLKLQHSLSPAFIGPSIALIIFLSAILRSSSFFFVIVIVSASYINIGRIIVVYFFIFVFFPNILLFNTFLLAWKALFADCIFASISVSLTPVSDTITPRYLNFSTTSKLNPPILILPPSAFLPSLLIFVLSSFSFNPISLPSVISSNISFIVLLLFVISTMPSAYATNRPPLVFLLYLYLYFL